MAFTANTDIDSSLNPDGTANDFTPDLGGYDDSLEKKTRAPMPVVK